MRDALYNLLEKPAADGGQEVSDPILETVPTLPFRRRPSKEGRRGLEEYRPPCST